MPPVIKKAISWLGLVEDDDSAVPNHPTAASKAARPVDPPPAAPYLPSAPDFSGDNSKTQFLNPNLVVIPDAYKSIKPIADRYQSGVVTVMDLRVMPVDDAKRCVDFFSGVVFALGGLIQRVANGLFLLVPAGAAFDQTTIDAVIAELR
ncbi:MAG: cell division protein SepF [Propionibacteriaceae bacterium]|nr:cell division protein SepF [Propionibacteriaceae bacterium]